MSKRRRTRLRRSKPNYMQRVLDDAAIANARLVVALEAAEREIEKLAFLSRLASEIEPLDDFGREADRLVSEYTDRDMGKLRLSVHCLMGAVRIAIEKTESRGV